MSVNSQKIAHNKYLSCIALICVAVFARFYQIGTESLWLDESYSLRFSNRSLLHALTSERTTPPLYYLVLHYWIKVFGQSEVALRSLSAIASLSAIPLTVYLGKILFGFRCGLLAAFFLSISSFQIYYAQEARAYVFLLPLILSSSILLVKILEDAQISKRWYWIVYVCLSILAVYTHIYAIFSIAAHNIIVLLALMQQSGKTKGLLSRWIFSQLSILLSFIPWILHMLSEVGSFANERRYLFLKLPQVVFSLIYGNQLVPIDEQATLNVSETLLDNAPLLVLAGLPVLLLGANGLCVIQRKYFSSMFVLLNFLVPLLLSFCITFFVPIFDEGYLIGVSPFLFLFLFSGFAENDQKFSHNRKSVYSLILQGAFALLVLLASIGLYRYYFDTRFGKEQWRDVASYIESIAETEDILVFDRYYHDTPYRYYQTLSHKDIKFKELEKLAPTQVGYFESEHIEKLLQHTRVWLIKIRSSNDNTESYLKRYYTEVNRKFFSKDKGILVVQLLRKEEK